MIVIIGHGSTPINKGWGKQIDKYEVIRFHEWDLWQNEADYGRRIDYCVVHRTFESEAARHKCRIFSFDTNKDFTIYYRDLLRNAGAKCTVAEVNPTRGFMAAMFAIDMLGTKDLLMVGCDALLDGIIKADHYPEKVLELYKELHPTIPNFIPEYTGKHYNGRHDYKVEGDVIKEHCRKKGVNLIRDMEYFK